MTAASIVLAFVTLQRLGELLLARKNTARLFAQGAVEHAPGHYPFIVLLHASWLATLWWLGHAEPVRWGWLAIFIALQILRVFVLASLGPRWTTRIVTLPGAPLVASGPFRVMRHPNYAIVVGEIAALPLALGLPGTALIFSILNAVMLTIRIRAENRALGLAPQSVR